MINSVYSNNSCNDGKKYAIGAGIGVAAGTATGLLTSGKAVSKELADSYVSAKHAYDIASSNFAIDNFSPQHKIKFELIKADYIEKGKEIQPGDLSDELVDSFLASTKKFKTTDKGKELLSKVTSVKNKILGIKAKHVALIAGIGATVGVAGAYIYSKVKKDKQSTQSV